MISSTPTAVLLTLTLLLTPGVKVEAIAIPDGQRTLPGHQRYHPPRAPDDLTGHGIRYIQRPHAYSQGISQPPGEGSQGLRRESTTDHVVGFLNSLNTAVTLKEEKPSRWNRMKHSINRRIDNFMAGTGASRAFFFASFDEFLTAFQSTLKRDAIYNVGKVGGLVILYYFFPGVLSWINNTFGSV